MDFVDSAGNRYQLAETVEAPTPAKESILWPWLVGSVVVGAATAAVLSRRSFSENPVTLIDLECEGQKYSSADTSLDQVARLFGIIAREGGFSPGTTNLDIGGGRFERTTLFLRELGVRNLVFDCFNRSEEHNLAVLKEVSKHRADTVTCANVLNVIQEPSARSRVIDRCARYIKPDGTAFFSVYYDSKRAPGKTNKGWQEQRPLASYEEEIRAHFRMVVRKKDVIRAKHPWIDWVPPKGLKLSKEQLYLLEKQAKTIGSTRKK